MSTRGWEHYTPPTLPRPKRRTLAAQAVEVGLAKREAEIQAECERWLRGEVESGTILCWTHVHNPKRDRPGLPDLIIGVRPGLVVAVELKAALGHTTEAQDRWLAAWGDHGAVCRSVGEMVARINEWRKSG